MFASIVMHLTHAAVAAILAASPTTSTNLDDTIHFGADGNVYVDQSTCDLDDPNISDEMMDRLQDWSNDVMEGRIDGRFICVNQ